MTENGAKQNPLKEFFGYGKNNKITEEEFKEMRRLLESRRSMDEESIFLDHVGDNPRMRVLQHLIEGRDLDYTLTDLLNAGVSWGTLNQLIPRLLEVGLIVKTRKIGRATLYKINQNNTVARQLIALYDNLILQKLNEMEPREIEVVA